MEYKTGFGGERMIDTDKYEGHTEGPWTLSEEYAYELFVYAGDVRLAKIDGNMENEANTQLIADAPDLLAEVKRLRHHLNLMIEKFGEAYLIETLIERGEEE